MKTFTLFILFLVSGADSLARLTSVNSPLTVNGVDRMSACPVLTSPVTLFMGELPPDSPGAGKFLRRHTDGLWMPNSFGTITLSMVYAGNKKKGCPRGNNPGNPPITVEVTYSDMRDLPPEAAVMSDFFTLSNNAAKSGPVRVKREGNKIKAEFDGANPTQTELAYTITYDDHKNPAIRSGIQKINRQPGLATTGNFICLGTPLVLQASGKGVTISTTDPNTTLTQTTALSATATSTVAGPAKFLATDADGCKSDYLTITVPPLPVITPENPSTCTGGTLLLIADRLPSGTSAWTLSPGTPAAVASLQAPTPPDGRKINFLAGTTAQNVTVQYIDNMGCKASASVAINEGLTLTHTCPSSVCTGTKTAILLHSSLSNTSYTWTVSGNRTGALPQLTPVASNRIEQTLTNSGEASVEVTYSVTARSGNCTSQVLDIVIEVSHLRPPTATIIGGGDYCVSLENNSCRTNLFPIASGDLDAEWTYTTFFPNKQAAGVISGNTQQSQKGALPSVNDILVLLGQQPAEVYYVFTPYTACIGTPSEPVRVRLHPLPVAGAVAHTSMCSSSDPAHPKTNIALSSTSTGVIVYTWTVDTKNSPDVTGYSSPLRDGVVVPDANPTEAVAGPVADALSLPGTAIKAQAIIYKITPWRNGCPGQSVSAEVTVYPRPVITGLASKASICHGTPTTINLNNSFSDPEKNRVTYSWTVSENKVGARPGIDKKAFEQQILSLNDQATEGSVTYTITPLYIPVSAGALSCSGQPATSVYTVARPVVAGTIDTTPVEACLGDPDITITMNTTPAGSIQWLKNGSFISAATGSSYVVETDVASDGEYKVRIANACNYADSGAKKVKVTPDAYFTTGKAVAVAGKEEEFVDLPVKFTYTGPAAVYRWDFDDQTAFSTEQSPSHSYRKAGTYHPKLKVERQKQAVCNKTFILAGLKIKEAIKEPVAGDPNSPAALIVFPVPAHDRLTIIHDDDWQHLTISDIRGKIVMSKAVSGREAVLSIGHLAEGIYILTVSGTKGAERGRIIINN